MNRRIVSGDPEEDETYGRSQRGQEARERRDGEDDSDGNGPRTWR